MNHEKGHDIIKNNQNLTICPEHPKNNNLSYCLDCNCHICKECMKHRKHMEHKKKIIVEIEPSDDEINSLLKVIKTYKDKINSSEIEKNNQLAEIKNKFNKETNSELNHHKDNIKWYYLLKFPSLRYKFLILCFLGFCISGSYTGISISVKRLPGDIFRNTMLFNIFEVFVGFLSGFLISTKLLGRKGTILSFYFIATISFLIILLHNLKEFEKIILILLLKFSIMGIFCIIYTYFIENYPTSIREIGLGINSGMDNIGGSLFPIITEVLKTRELYVILAILNIIEFTLMWFMPETNGIPLPETIKEIEEINEKEIDLSNKLIIFEKDSTQLEDEKMNLINSEK
jgi:hypothetical protein